MATLLDSDTISVTIIYISKHLFVLCRSYTFLPIIDGAPSLAEDVHLAVCQSARNSSLTYDHES
jgi:hypothetical protein